MSDANKIKWIKKTIKELEKNRLREKDIRHAIQIRKQNKTNEYEKAKRQDLIMTKQKRKPQLIRVIRTNHKPSRQHPSHC